MIAVALKMLVGDRLKYFALVAGLAFAALLVTQQASIFTGYALQTGAWVRDTGAGDLWVTDPQMEHVEDIKPMVDTALLRVRGVEGVAHAVPMYKGFLKARLQDGTLETVRLVGLDDATLLGGPPEMVEGTLELLRRDKGVIVNRDDLATTLRLRRGDDVRPMRVGDRLDVNDREMVVVGTYRKTPEFFWEPVLYTTYSRAVGLAPRERKNLTYILVKAQAGVDVAALGERIEAQTGLRARTTAQFNDETTMWLLDRTGILVNFGLTIALGFVIGVLVAALLLYTFVLENVRYFAALKAMGASDLRIVGMVCVQVLFVGLVGFGLGLGGACLTGLAFTGGGLAFAMVWQVPLVGLIAILTCCFVAGVVSLARVLSLEPAVVFKG